MKTMNVLILAVALCAILCAGNAAATKLSPVPAEPSVGATSSSSNAAGSSADLSRPAADFTRPTADIIKPAPDITRPQPEFQRPLRELKPSTFSGTNRSNNLENATFTKKK